MDQAAINEIVKFLKESLIQSGIKVESIALFGSALSGEIRGDSDIDLIVISADFRDKDIFERSKLTMEPEIRTFKKFKIPMDILNMSPEEYHNLKLKMLYPSQIVA